jgi:hypothetical protein
MATMSVIRKSGWVNGQVKLSVIVAKWLGNFYLIGGFIIFISFYFT